MKHTLLTGLITATLVLIDTSAYAKKTANNTTTPAPVQLQAQIGDPVGVWLKDPAFKKLYIKALGKSPVTHSNSWAHKDIGLAPSQAFVGQNANTWIRLSTCSNNITKRFCRLNHIDIFYDVENQQLFAYLRLGGRVGWIGNERIPTSLEQKFFQPLLTADALLL
jgi:hypothetical protein